MNVQSIYSTFNVSFQHLNASWAQRQFAWNSVIFKYDGRNLYTIKLYSYGYDFETKRTCACRMHASLRTMMVMIWAVGASHNHCALWPTYRSGTRTREPCHPLCLSPKYVHRITSHIARQHICMRNWLVACARILYKTMYTYTNINPMHRGGGRAAVCQPFIYSAAQ